MVSYQVPAQQDQVKKMIEPIIEVLEKNGGNIKAIYSLRLSLEELLVNVVNYAYEGKEGMIKLTYDINEWKRFIKITISDQGKEFNPLASADPDLGGTAEERQIGGLGIFLVKKNVDKIKYERINNENRLEIIKTF